MQFLPTDLPGVIIVEPKVFGDERGFFMETYRQPLYVEGGIPLPFVQDNHSRSRKGVLRGLHFQLRHPQGKLVRVVNGEIFDVAVDARRSSPTFGKWVGVTLSDANRRQLYVPPGFAHGFCVVSESADVLYKTTDIYQPADERSIAWNDPTIAIEWPVTDPIVSAKDQAAPRLEDAECFG